MYAIVETGGKQYKVAVGDRLKIEQVVDPVDHQICLKVLMVADGEVVIVGDPFIEKASVKATVVAKGRHDKVQIFKMRRRKHYQRHLGHRQNFTEIEINEIAR